MESRNLDIENVIQNQMIQAAKILENQLDEEIERIDNLDDNDLEIIKAKRIRALKKNQEKKKEWLENGHGSYDELSDEKAFFNATRKSKNVVVHFYRDETFRCKIFDKHLVILAHKHLETKFCKINAEKCPFLTDRLRIKVIPTIAIIKDSKTKDYIVGFTELGNIDDFSSDMLEWRIAQSEVINYNGDLLHPPDEVKKISISIENTKSKTIREKDISSDENDW